MLHHVYPAQIEYREWERKFNVRAARGEFVQHTEQVPQRAIQPRQRPTLGQIRQAIGAALSAVWSAIK